MIVVIVFYYKPKIFDQIVFTGKNLLHQEIEEKYVELNECSILDYDR